MAEIPFEVAIVETEEPPIYQLTGARAVRFRELRMSFPEIGQALGVSHTTAAKVARWPDRHRRPKG